MALFQVASVGGGVVVLYVDLDVDGTCLGARLVNGSTRDVTVTLFRPGDDIATGTYAPGEHNRNLPKPRRFIWDTADMHVELTVRWP